MLEVKSSEEWESYAKLLDYLEGCVDWKYESQSEVYDYQRIAKRTQTMKQLRKSDNIKTLAQCLRQDLMKNIGNISDPSLYNRCHLGTKRTIEKYQDEVINCIKAIYYADSNLMGIETKLEFFSETRHSYGRTALLLSGGATFGKFHFGLLSALYEHDLFPRIICGSSVGALVAAAVCCYPYSEMPKLFNPEVVFGHPMLKTLAESNAEFIWKMLTGETILCAETLKEYIQQHSGDMTFKEIYDRYGWNLNVTVTDFSMNQ